MTHEKESGRSEMMWIAAAVLLAIPGFAHPAEASRGGLASWRQSADSGQSSQQATGGDREQEARDREQAARDREQEKRDREHEKRDREQEKVDRMEELYDGGRETLDDERYDKAAGIFEELARMNGPQTDAALYWKAYAENKLGKRDAALATIADLKRRFPQSRWQNDAGALEIEVRQSAGQRPRPEEQSNEELRLLAIQGLMNNAPERAIPLLEKRLNSSASPKEKAQVLFVLAQSDEPQAVAILERVARGQSNPEVQRKAIEYLGMFDSKESRQALASIYASSSDASVKRAILRSYMMVGDQKDLFAAAKGEKDPQVRREAIQQLGMVDAPKELEELYRAEASPEVREEILQALFLAGDAGKLAEAAQNEKDPKVRRMAIEKMGLMDAEETSQSLQKIYAKETDRDLREAVLNAFFLQDNAHALIAVARGEKDPQLRKIAVSKLSLMDSKEATDFLMEILQK
ncbi:MAG TPA: HEAT repeat domain-containing protein [Candidatus Acidoferrum sp.]|nr:HEAT repeat domain-containing protein [Candidatus Acidoferrum sp.]